MNAKFIGEKIKKLRKERGLTQSELAGKIITRNMLSSIENGKALPSLETLNYIAANLEVPPSYLISEEDDILFYRKKELISQIYRAYSAKNYTACINLINSISDTDNELSFLLASSYLFLGKIHINHGSLLKAIECLDNAYRFSSQTVIETDHLNAQILLYQSIAKNVQSPLLEFDAQKYSANLLNSVDFEFFKYLTLDYSFAFENAVLSLHLEAKKLMLERNYNEAIKRLLNASELSKKDDFNAFVIFGIYTDLEYCYKQLYNFEKAYLYSTKRITLLENFKT
ncbi:MAG: helix-turn-helix transcriptional regulator [Ruminococcaceae bacterium]|nr:helix-turn-helix transcriptional regulator [Oscillospiraceae bacterium]